MQNIRSSYFQFILFLLLCAAGLSGCEKASVTSEDIRVRVPWGQNGNLQWTTLKLSTLKNPYSLKGQAAELLIRGDVSGSGELVGDEPRLQLYKNKLGEYVAKDSLSLQMLTLYAHLEKLKELDQKMGLENILSWPRKVAVQFRLEYGGGYLANNAFYSGQVDGLFFVPYEQEELPIPVNGGVVAHEHFHALFHHIYRNPLYKAEAYPSGDYHEVLLRGLNEGLADVWGWIYTGDDFFVPRSIEHSKARRRTDIPITQMTGKTELQSWVKNSTRSSRLSLGYALGNQYARAIIGMARSHKIDSIELGKMIISSLREYTQKRLQWRISMLAPEDFLEILATKVSTSNPRACVYLKKMYSKTEVTVSQCQN